MFPEQRYQYSSNERRKQLCNETDRPPTTSRTTSCDSNEETNDKQRSDRRMSVDEHGMDYDDCTTLPNISNYDHDDGIEDDLFMSNQNVIDNDNNDETHCFGLI